MTTEVVLFDRGEHRCPVEEAKPGFASLVDSVVGRGTPTETLSQIAHRLLTLDNRQSLGFGLRSLTTEQTALLDLTGNFVPSLGQPPVGGTAEDVWSIGLWDYGRILLTNELPEPGCYRIIAWLPLSKSMSEEVRERSKALRAKQSRWDLEVEQFLTGLTEEEKREVVRRVHDGIDHIDPVLIHVNECTFTAFGPYNNLLRKSDALLERLKHVPADEWLPNEQRFIACFYWLLQAGMRGEEFNGQQLTPETLNTHFDFCWASFARLQRIPVEEFAGTLSQKATRLAKMRRELSRDYLTYRFINGLNFNKQERFARRAEQRAGVADLPPDLREYLESQCGFSVGAFTDLEALFRSCVDSIALQSGTGGSLSLTGIEALLQRTVESAIDALKSDIGMTRGLRDVQRWQLALDARRYTEICEWPTTDYFCAVFPSRRMSKLLRDHPDQLAKILTACSVRMQFNSWHYMPGHFPADSVPPGRHFYYPPRMPDTAVWCNQHHAGHVMASVKHSIRAPAALRHRDQIYHGMVDLRVFRSHGEPYTDAELFAAMKYAEYLRCIYQAAADITAATDRQIVIEAFDKPWFDWYASSQSPAAGRVERDLAVL